MIIGQWVKVGPWWAYTDGEKWTCEDISTQNSLELVCPRKHVKYYTPSYVGSMVEMAVRIMNAEMGKTVDDGVEDPDDDLTVF